MKDHEIAELINDVTSTVKNLCPDAPHQIREAIRTTILKHILTPWLKIESVNDLPTETDLWFHNGFDAFQSYVDICADTGEKYIVDNEGATHWMEIPEVGQGS